MRPSLPLAFPSAFLRKRLQKLETATQNGQILMPVTPQLESLKPRGDYIVHRSQTGNLPVYTDKKKNGHVKTLIRKIEGDHQNLRADLNDYFAARHTDPFKRYPEFVLKPVTKHLEARGVDWTKEVRTWLRKQGH